MVSRPTKVQKITFTIGQLASQLFSFRLKLAGVNLGTFLTGETSFRQMSDQAQTKLDGTCYDVADV